MGTAVGSTMNVIPLIPVIPTSRCTQPLAKQVSPHTGEPSNKDVQDGQRPNRGAEGKSGVDQILADEESGDADPSPSSRDAQGSPEENILGSIDSDAEVTPGARGRAAQDQATYSTFNIFPSAPPANETEVRLSLIHI